MLPFWLSWNSSPAEYGGFALCGRFSGIAATIRLHRHLVTQWLPGRGEFRLPRQSDSPLHPVLFLMGQQQQLHHRRGRLRIDYAFGREYDELIVVIPDVELNRPGHTGHGLRLSVYTALYLTARWSTMLGRFVYGFRKHYSRIINEASRFDVFNTAGQSVYSTRVTTGNAVDNPESSSSPDNILRFLNQPVAFAGRRGLAIRQFQYRLESRSVIPVSLEIQMKQGLLGKRPMVDQQIQVRRIDACPWGAFQFSSDWECRTMDVAAMASREPPVERINGGVQFTSGG